MKERPILMSAPMVRATLREVDPKTQTRRVVPDWQKPRQLDAGCYMAVGLRHPRWGFGCFGDTEAECANELGKNGLCQYGKSKDRLWVRENGWERPERTPKMMREGADTWEPYYFDADGYTDIEHEQFKEWGFKRRPSIHMPRGASRILLEIVSVRVERLQDISEEDAYKEGCDHQPGVGLMEPRLCYRRGFEKLWKSINGPGSWDANPWVWVIEFKRVKP